MKIARIKKGIVINVEIWSSLNDAKNSAKRGETLVPYTDSQPAHVGLNYSEKDGFEQLIEPNYQSGVLVIDQKRLDQDARREANIRKMNEELIAKEKEIGLIGHDEQFFTE